MFDSIFSGKMIAVCLALLSLIGGEIVSCGSLRWEYVGTHPFLHKANDIWFKQDIGIFSGHFISDKDMESHRGLYKRLSLHEAIILRIDYKNGSKWHKVYSGKGDILRIIEEENGDLVALGRTYSETGEQSAYLLRSADIGKTWHTMPSPPEAFIGIDLTQKDIGYGWTGLKFYKTIDKGNSWQLIKEFEYEYDILQIGSLRPMIDRNGALWFYSFAKNFLGKLSPDGGLFVESTNGKFIDSLFVSSDSSLWMIARKKSENEKEVLLLKKTDQNNTQIVSKLPDSFLSTSLFVGENVISVWGSDMSKIPPKRKLLLSYDHGLTWKEEAPKDSYAHGPVFFENENVLWNIATEDKIQRRIGK